ncbi:PTS lactose/cellobiose transporter subunit IIA [Virgibacillus halophilus]
MDINETAFKIILHGGNARSQVMEALKVARGQQIEQAQSMLQKADKELTKAHQIQSDILKNEASGEKVESSLLFIHAQDHLMTAMLARDLAEEIIDLRNTNMNK